MPNLSTGPHADNSEGRAVNLGYPARGLAYIRRVTTVETYANSPIVITPKTRDGIVKQQFEIIAVGDFEYCDDEWCSRRHSKREFCFPVQNVRTKVREHPHDLVEGDWVLAKNRSWGATPDPDVFVIRQSDCLARFTVGRRNPPAPAPSIPGASPSALTP